MTKLRAFGMTVFVLICSTPIFAQYAADVFRYSEINQTGTARFQAIGGNHSALGGDPSTISGNPAGLGFYNRSEITFTPAVTGINTKTNYIDGTTSFNKSNFNIGQASLVITSQPNFQRKWKRSSFGISYSRQQSFQDGYNYGGLNNNSAYVDQVVEKANRGTGTPLTQLENDFEASPTNGGPIAYSVPAAYYQMYLISPSNATGPPYTALDQTSTTNQYGTFNSTGSNSQWNIAYAGNYNDKLYIGGSVAFSRIRYNYDRTFQDNYVKSPELIQTQHNEGLSVTGNGINLSLGVIYKINPIVQFGGVLTTPTFTAIKETFNQSISARYVDNLVSSSDGTLITPPYESLPIAANDFQYSMVSPFRGSFGATVFAQSNGFVTASLEYVGYSGMNVKTKYLSSTENDQFKSDTKAEIKDTYRNTVNLRIGGEYKVGILGLRLGVAYLADPYLDRSEIKRNKLLYSAGLGVRKSKFFADLTGTLSSYKTAFTPYVLNNVAKYSSVNIKNTPVNVMLTVGTFF